MMADDPSQPEREPISRSPCVPIVIAYGVGIGFDHVFPISRLLLFFAAGLISLLAAGGFGLGRAYRVALLLLLTTIVGALSHRAAWNDRDEDSVVRLLKDERQLVKLTGTIASVPNVDRRRDSGRSAAWILEDRTRVVVALDSLIDDDSVRHAMSGCVQLSVTGHLSHIEVADRIEAIGWISRPEPPSNPGGFDSRHYLRQRRVDAIVFADHPDAVRRLATPTFYPVRTFARLRRELAAQFASHLSPKNSAIGSAMILGDRSAIPIEIRDSYVSSGAMHILAISGLHVGILAALMTYVARLLNVPNLATAIGITAMIWGYAVLTNLSPSVVRASVFISLWCIAKVVLRQTSLLNVTAVTALILLVWNPLYLFDVGAQLSFLAVLGMSWSMRLFTRFGRQEAESEKIIMMRRWMEPTISLQLLGIGIWIFTAPITAAYFGIVSPVGILLNAILLPLTTVVMWCGYLYLASCLFIPFCAWPLAAVFDLGLTAINSLVGVAGDAGWGHWLVPGPPAWWLLGYYPLLAATLVCPMFVQKRMRAFALLLFWSVVGVAASALPSPTKFDGVRMTALDVGHGGAILIEAPSGATMLFDCGSMQDDRRGAESVWHCLRGRGHASLDALVISHADLDHCNNVPALVGGGTVQNVLINRSFLKLDQHIVKEACDASLEHGSRIRLVSAGDVVRLDDSITVQVLHPTDRPPGEDDNANSLVMRVEYAGRSLLLTGDVEGSGFQELKRNEPRGGFDVVIAPHHGGLLANTAAFADWSSPKSVIVSCGDRVNEAAIREIYSNASQVYFTSRDGAIVVEVSKSGRLAIQRFGESN